MATGPSPAQLGRCLPMKSTLALSTALVAAAFAFGAVAADSPSLLTGKIVGTDGTPLAGIPVKAHRDKSSITVSVYSDAKGNYSFPSWSDLKPGSYSVAVELPV